MFTHRPGRAARLLSRTGIVLAFLTLTATMAPALADTPVQWEDSSDVSALDVALVLVIIPGGIAVVLALLSLLGSARSSSVDPTEAWRGEGDWFGGPNKGVAAADDVERGQVESSGSGGTSGRW